MCKPFVFEPFQCIALLHMKRLALKVILLRRITSKDAVEIIQTRAQDWTAVTDSQELMHYQTFLYAKQQASTWHFVMEFWLHRRRDMYPQLYGNLSWYMHYPWHDFNMKNQNEVMSCNKYENMLTSASFLALRLP